MASSTRITELAGIIQSNTAKLDEYLKVQGLKSPSFEIDAPEKLSLPAAVAKAREAILDATNELHNIVLGPVQFLTGYNYNSLVSIQAIEKYKIANSFPIGKEASFAEIAKACSLNEDDTKKILRQAMTQHIFKEPRKGYVAHTAISKQIAQNPLMQDWIFFMCTEAWRSAPRLVDAMVKWPGSEEAEETGWVLANNATGPLMQEIFKYPERLQRMPGAMQMSEQGDGLEPWHFVDNTDWTGVKTFVDLGGAHGSLSFEVAKKVPSVKCIVQDLPFILSTAKAPEEVASRIEYMPHNFFEPQPVKGADIYFFRWIFHNWSDKYAIKILRSLIPALKRGARIVANEFLLPEPGVLSPYQETLLRNFDISMKQLLNAKERDAEDWAALFKAADPGFKLQRIQMPKESKLAIVEVIGRGTPMFS